MKRLNFGRLRAGLAMAVVLGALAACETATPYQPLQPGNATSGGYSEQKVANDRYQVSFQGNSLTERETVERYLLYRSAELTLQQGFDWFELVDRNTEQQTQKYNAPVADSYFAWTPTWYYLGRGRWTVIDNFDPFAFDFETQEVTRYQATAEIFLGHGAKPANDAKAFDAHEVTANLAPTLKRPETKK